MSIIKKILDLYNTNNIDNKSIYNQEIPTGNVLLHHATFKHNNLAPTAKLHKQTYHTI